MALVRDTLIHDSHASAQHNWADLHGRRTTGTSLHNSRRLVTSTNCPTRSTCKSSNKWVMDRGLTMPTQGLLKDCLQQCSSVAREFDKGCHGLSKASLHAYMSKLFFFFILPFRGTLSGQEVAGLGQQGGSPLPGPQEHLQQQGIAGLAPFASLLSAVLLCRCHVLQFYGQDAQRCCIITHLSPHTAVAFFNLTTLPPDQSRSEAKKWG